MSNEEYARDDLRNLVFLGIDGDRTFYSCDDLQKMGRHFRIKVRRSKMDQSFYCWVTIRNIHCIRPRRPPGTRSTGSRGTVSGVKPYRAAMRDSVKEAYDDAPNSIHHLGKSRSGMGKYILVEQCLNLTETIFHA